MSNDRQVAHFDSPTQFGSWLKKLEPQMALALPTFMKPGRITRLALTVFSSNPELGNCSQRSIAASILTACQLGLEPNVNGQGYLITYKGTCTFVPGWKGLVDLANRSGRCTVWTGAVYKGDDFDYALGDRPFVTHKPGDNGDDNPANLTHVYAIGRIKGNDVPVIEVWPIRKIANHRDKFNKVGKRHYSYDNWEMYARKVPLLQVLKYMPQSIELTAAMDVANAAERGQNVVIDAETWVATPDPSASDDGAGNDDDSTGAGAVGLPALSDEDFANKAEGWKKAIAGGKTVNDVIATAETKNTLTQEQKVEIASWAIKGTSGQGAAS
jgi:recombination protein RecT